EYAGAGNRERLIGLLTPIQKAAEKSELARELVASGDIYHPLAWSPEMAYRFLRDVPIFEDSGLIVRVPNWWRAAKSSRPVVNVTIGKEAKTRLDADALLDFSVNVTVDGQVVSDEELKSIMAASNGLMLLKGQWVEIDKEKLSETLGIWKQVEAQAGSGGLSFLEGMRMLSGVGLAGIAAATATESTRAWSDVVPDDWLAARLAELRNPEAAPVADAPTALTATLRPYQ
ncbi:SNF2-related protein, partial [mine drainage metagenome]